MNELLEILSEVKPGVDFESETALVDDAILDSLDIISIISEVSDEFDVRISPEDIIPENFNSAEAMWSLISELMED
ncbi:MAG: acyl carrier protein [Clostridia bacterium]|nr:acyl carrier protein [Clostridia bacterium]